MKECVLEKIKVLPNLPFHSKAQKVTIDARHCSIFLPEFSVAWLKEKKFAFVLNALDNVKARNHVNRLCLAANLPLVESGTSGYFGETSIIRKGETKCYECIVSKSTCGYFTGTLL